MDLPHEPAVGEGDKAWNWLLAASALAGEHEPEGLEQAFESLVRYRRPSSDSRAMYGIHFPDNRNQALLYSPFTGRSD